MSVLTPARLAEITGGTWLVPWASGVGAPGVGLDTRDDLTGRIFIAVRGERHDGHDHLGAAAAGGAVAALVDRDVPEDARPAGLGLLRVHDTRRALGQLAHAHRCTLTGVRVVAITGSAGKTTTKEIVHAVLGTVRRGTAAPKSFNNDIGVPLTLLAARPGDDYVVVEIGMNAPGEIAALAALVEPDVAVITSVGRAHLERLGTVDAIAREKASIVDHVRAGGTSIINGDAAALAPFVPDDLAVVRFGGRPGCAPRLTARAPGWFEVDGGTRFKLPLPGRHNAMNAIAAVAVARTLGLSDAAIEDGLARVEPPPMRMTVTTIGEVAIYNDAYNANPDSMAAALETFVEIAPSDTRRVIVLGDMLELGAAGPALHAALGDVIASVGAAGAIGHAVLVGPLAAHTADALRRHWPAGRVAHVETLDADAVERIRRMVMPGDSVLFKASRGIALERVIAALETDPGRLVLDERHRDPSDLIGGSTAARPT